MYNSKNGTLRINDDTMHYITFGKGTEALIMLPGLGDALKTVKGMAFTFSFIYRKLAKRFRIYVFSRKNNLPAVYSSRDMARDTKAAMDALGIEKAHIVGVSQGGTIAQWLAIDYPESVNKLILAVTYAKANETIDAVIGKWLEYAEKKDYKSIFIDTAEHSYSEKYLKKNRKYYGLMSKLTKPKSLERFITQSNACLTHDTFGLLHQISAQTLIIGGKNDKIVTAQASEELAAYIKNSELFLYDGLGHALYDEAKDFSDKIINFISH